VKVEGWQWALFAPWTKKLEKERTKVQQGGHGVKLRKTQKTLPTRDSSEKQGNKEMQRKWEMHKFKQTQAVQ